MTCQTEEQIFERLAAGESDDDWLEHLSACETCGAVRRDYELLAHTISKEGGPDELTRALGDAELGSGIMAAIAAQDEAGARIASGDFESADLKTDIMKAVRPPRRPWLHWVVPLAVAAAGVLVLLPRATDDGFRVRGADAEPDRWVSVEGYVIDTAGAPTLLGDNVAPTSRLAFAARNAAESGFAYLMIFGVDAGGHVFWYYPEWTDAAASPMSVPVPAGPDRLELMDAIAHDLQPGPLRIFALFSERAFDVRSVERVVAHALKDRSVSELERLPIANTGQHSLLTVVGP